MADPIEQFLNRLHHPSLAQIDLGLDRMLRLLSMLGNPHKRLPPVIHVAGTNGKGSLIAYLKAIFEAAGLRVHVYTSPHLVEFRERIVLNGKMIENAEVQRLATHLARILEQQPATFFEATTALAFLAFAQKPADVLLLEVGVGGKLDATNVIDKPILTAITPIAMDHMEYLGDTIQKIAGEKAGIMKKDVPCVVGRQSPEVMAVLEAQTVGATLSRLGHEWNMQDHSYISPTLTLTLTPALAGEHQFDNAATAVACVEQLKQFNITEEHIAQGLQNAVWPARLERLTKGRYAAMIDAPLWLDGGHNPQGGEVLGAWLSQQNVEKYLICGMVQGKDAKGFLEHIAPHATALYAIAIPEEATSQKPETLAASAAQLGLEAQVAASIEIALRSIAERAKKPYLVCICGSLYLAGKVLAQQ